MTMEVRSAAVAWPTLDFELRAVGDGMEFRGYAAVFDSPSEDLGGFRETIKPGAFTRAINAAANGQAEIRMFWHHDQNRPLGSTKANVRLSQDDRGLLAEATLPDTTDGRDMARLIRDGIVRSMSFGFSVDNGGDSWSQDHKERTLHAVRLFEVSPVTGWPAYRATSASVRHLFGMADWDDTESVDALVDDLTDSQRESFFRSLNRGRRFIAPSVADLLARLEARKAA